MALLVALALTASACADSGGTNDGAAPTLSAPTIPPDGAAASQVSPDATMAPGDATDGSGADATLPAETLPADEAATEVPA